MFQAIFEASPDAMIVVDGEGIIVLANGRAAQLFGCEAGELVGMPVEALVPAAVQSEHRAHRQRYMANPRVRPMGNTGMRLTGRRRNGSEFPVEIGLSPLRTADGMRFVASIRDVSQSQRMHDAVVRMHYDAVVSRLGQLTLESSGVDIVERAPSLLAETLDIEAVAILLLEPNGVRCEIRAAAGLDRFDGDAQSWFDSPHSALGRVLASGQPQVVNGPEPTGTAAPLPLADVRSHAVMPLLDRGRPMGALLALSRQPRRFNHDAQHLLLSTANLLSALLQRNRSEEQLAHAQRLDAIGQLTGGIAHDFNNLLTVMSGNLQLLEEECRPLPAASATIAAALRSVERGTALTAKLLAFARRQQLRPRPLDAGVLLQDLRLMLRRTLGSSIKLELDCADDLPELYADSAQLEASLLNLVLNARDAMPRGGRIGIQAREYHAGQELSGGPAPGRYVLISVVDTGHGMLPAVKARALEPFFTTKPPGRGNGLGLSMVYGFARQSGGHLNLDSRLGYGTRVDLYLPVAAPPATAAATPSTHIATGSERILVVEDEPAVRRVATRFLRSLGYRVEAVPSADKALAALATTPDFRLLFTDIMLGGGMSGAELATVARARQADLAVLLTSGFPPDELVPDPQAVGFELLPKPYRREQLAAAVQRCLAG